MATTAPLPLTFTVPVIITATPAAVANLGNAAPDGFGLAIGRLSMALASKALEVLADAGLAVDQEAGLTVTAGLALTPEVPVLAGGLTMSAVNE